MTVWLGQVDPQIQTVVAILIAAVLAIFNIAAYHRSWQWSFALGVVTLVIVVGGVYVFLGAQVAALVAAFNLANIASAMWDWRYHGRNWAGWALWPTRSLIYAGWLAGSYAILTGEWLGWLLTVLGGMAVGALSLLTTSFYGWHGRSWGRMLALADPRSAKVTPPPQYLA